MSMNWFDLIRGMLQGGASAEDIEDELSDGEEEIFGDAEDFLEDEEED